MADQPDNLDRLAEIVDRAATLDAGSRIAYLDDTCGQDAALRAEVDALLAAREAQGDFFGSPTQATVQPESTGPSEEVGETIGRYKLLELIGEGGFGRVWAAEQREPVKRRVALKIIKLGMDTKQVIARFEAERQALAMMDHLHIAKVFDAGSTETGRPYFVMELVKGVPILQYCDSQTLDTRARLELFMQVCHAIQHAHQKGIIHRDIKPSNVLVAMHDGKPVPKVIDFGIAKATNHELTEKTLYTQHRQVVGTPAYMSPEQAEMSGFDIDTRSDIYSLGVLLYELLTGTTPFDTRSLMEAGFAEMMRIIREEEPHKPSTRLSSLGDTASRTAQQRRVDIKQLNTILRGDLDWIVMRCIEKDRTRRYESASGVAEDIRRHLDDLPVSAGPPSAAYTLRKFVKRNRGRVAAASVVALALILGVIGTTAGMLWAFDEKERAETAEADAEARADELEVVTGFQSEQLASVEADVMGIGLRRAILDAVPEDERDDLSERLGRVNFTNVALVSLEENVFGRSIDAIDRQFAEQPLVRAHLLQTAADTLLDVGLREMARRPQEQALAIRREHLGDDDPLTVRSVHRTGVLLHLRGLSAEAEPYVQEAVDTGRGALGDAHPETVDAISSMGIVLQGQGELAAAEPYFREALDARRRELGDDHRDTMTSVNNLGAFFFAQGNLPEAEAHFREALDGRRRLLGDEHRDTIGSFNDLGMALQAQGKRDEALDYFHQALETSRLTLGDEHPQTLTTINNIGGMLRAGGDNVGAERYYAEALETRRRVLGDEHPHTLTSINNMGVFLKELGKLDEAERYYREVLDASSRVHGDDHPDTLRAINNMAVLLKTQGKLEEAEPFHYDLVERCRRVLGEDHPNTLISTSNLGGLLEAQGRSAEAEPYYRAAFEGLQRVLGGEHPNTLLASANVAMILVKLDRADEALDMTENSLAIARRVLAEGEPNLARILEAHGSVLVALDRFADALEPLREAHDVFAGTLGGEHPRTQGVVGAIVGAFDAWHEAEPDAGHDATADEWRAKLVEGE